MNDNPELDKMITDAVSMVKLAPKHQPSDSDVSGLAGLAVALFVSLKETVAETILAEQVGKEIDILPARNLLLNGLSIAYALGYERGSNQDPTTKAGTELLKSLERGEHA